MIPDSTIDAVLARVDIVDLVGERVALRRSGQHYFGLCPFHAEKTPSFSVSRKRGRYHCFGCGADGDAIEFVRQTQHLGFEEAVRLLAERTGVPIPKADPKEAAQVQARNDRRKRLLGLVKHAHDRYQQRLEQLLSQGDNPVANYCRQRGITAEVARRHGIGYAEADALADLIRAHPQDCLDAGLARLAQRRGGEQLVALMRGRLVFPIRDERGQVVAFGGRAVPGVLPDPTRLPPKYVNSPETELYRKRDVLYRFSDARDSIARARRSIVVEGYMDALTLAESGFHETVACCGTALTDTQLARLLKVADSVVFVFDGDAAGQQAALRAASLALSLYQEGAEFRFLRLPDGLDPDEFIRVKGVQAFEAAVSTAPVLSEYLLSAYAEKNNGLATVEDCASYLRQLRSLVSPMGASAFAKLLMREAYRRLYSHGYRRQFPPPSDGYWVKPSPIGHFTPELLEDDKRDFWTDLRNAVRNAPKTALMIKEKLEGILNPEFPNERQVLSALEEVCQWARENEGSLPEDRIVAADLLCSSPRLIAKKRMDAAIQSLKTLFDNARITEAEYLHGSKAIIEWVTARKTCLDSGNRLTWSLP